MPAATCHPNPGAIMAFVHLMGEQRSQPGWTPAVTRPPEKLCLWNTWQRLMPMSPDDATEVRHCQQKTSGEITGEEVAGLSLTSSDRTTVLADLIAHSSASTTPPTDPGEVVLALLRTNGELIWVRTVAGQEHQLTWEDASGRPMVWTPDAQSQAILDDYARR